jgi:hypothetical protein
MPTFLIKTVPTDPKMYKTWEFIFISIPELSTSSQLFSLIFKTYREFSQKSAGFFAKKLATYKFLRKPLDDVEENS